MSLWVADTGMCQRYNLSKRSMFIESQIRPNGWLIMTGVELETVKYKRRHDLVDKGTCWQSYYIVTINYIMPFYDQLISAKYKILFFPLNDELWNHDCFLKIKIFLNILTCVYLFNFGFCEKWIKNYYHAIMHASHHHRCRRSHQMTTHKIQTSSNYPTE